MTRLGCTYQLSDPITLEIRYVGQTTAKNPENRYGSYSGENDNTHKSRWIQFLLRQGKKPIFEIIEDNISIEDLNWAEIYRIALFRFLGYRLTNVTDGGEGTHGYKHTAEDREKIRAFFIRKPKTKEHCAKMSLAFKDKPRSAETCKKMSISMLGKPGPNKDKPSSIESREKNRIAHTGKPSGMLNKHHTEETRKKISIAVSNPSIEIRKKMSDARLKITRR